MAAVTSGPTDERRAIAPAVVVALGVAAAAALGSVVSAEVPAPAYWLAAFWTAWAVTLGVALVGRRPSLALAGLQFFVLLEILAPATIAVVEGRTKIGIFDVTAGTVGALELSVLAQGSILAGALAARAVAPGGAGVVRATSVPSAARLDRWAFGLLAVAVASLVAYVVIAHGDPRNLVVLVGEAKYNDFLKSADGAVVKYFSSLVGLAGAAIVVVGLRLSVHGWRRPFGALAVLVVSAAILTSGGGRWFLVIPAVATALVWLRTAHGTWARHPRMVLLAGTALLFVFAVLVGGLRDQAGVKTIDAGQFVDKQLRGGTFATTAVLVDTVPSHYPYLEGRSYAEVAAMPVPRALWPDKPEGAVKDLQREFFSKEIGASFPFYGELYANFGWWGTALGCAGFGFLLELVWIALMRARTAAAVVVWAALVPTMLQMFSRGYLAGLIAGVFGFVVGIGFLGVALRRVDRRAGARRRPRASRSGTGSRLSVPQ